MRCFAAEVRTQQQFGASVNAAFKVGKKIVGVRIIFETLLNYCFHAAYIGRRVVFVHVAVVVDVFGFVVVVAMLRVIYVFR